MMSGQDIANLVINKLNSINWGAYDNSLHRDLAMNAVATGIQQYINNNWSISATTIGTLTLISPPGATAPYSESVNVNMVIGQAISLKSMLIAMTSMAQNIVPFFSALSSWLSIPPWIVTITSGTVLNPVTGVGVATFPSMAAMGAACLSELSIAKPNNMNSAWAIVSKHIYNGLMANLIAPIATVGTHPTGAYVGVTNCILTF